MANIQDDRLGRLLDKIDRLTVVLENIPFSNKGRGNGGNITPSPWRRKTLYDYKDTGRWKDLTKKEQSEFAKMQKDMVSSFDKQLKQIQQSISKNERRNRHEKTVIDDERNKINDKLNDPNTLLNERKSYKDRLKELAKEERELDEKLNKQKKEELELRKKRNKVAKQDVSEFWGHQTKHGPNYGSMSAWKRMQRDNPELADEYGNDYETYRRQAQRDRHTKKREQATETIYGYGMGNTAFGRFAQNAIDRNQRIDNYANFGRILQGSGGKTIATAMFGNGKMGGMASKALGGFGKELGIASKALGKFVPGLNIALAVFDALKMLGGVIGDIVGEWKKYTAEMIKFQMQEEQLQYENTKRIATLANESAIEDVKYNGDIQLKMMDVQSQNLIDAVSLNNDQYVNAVQTALGPMMQGINASAYQAAENRISAAAQFQRNLNVKDYREKSQGRYNKLREQEYQSSKASIEAEENIANVEYATKSAENSLKQEQYRGTHAWQSIVRDNDARQVKGTITSGGGEITSSVTDSEGGGTINPATGREYGDTGRYNDNGLGMDITNALRNTFTGDGLREGVQAKVTAMLEYQNQQLRNQADWNKTDIENRYKLTNTELQYANEIADKQQEVATKVQNKFVDAAETVEKTWLKLAQSQEQYLDKVDKVTNNTGISMGFTNQRQLHGFQKMLMQEVIKDAYKFGKNADDVAKAQSTYIETTGRNKTMGRHDYGQLFGLGKYLGDDNLAMQFGSEMEIFNHGIEDSVDMLDEVLKDVNKIGLNGRKYTKDLVSNLKLAHRYNFKDGTKGLMEMAKWAQNTRFNLSSLSGMLNKVQEGGIEDVITQSAGFQVLGGHAAINSDPLGMLYDAWADPRAYAQRMQDMTKGFGRFDAKTGETDFNINESMQIAQIAKLQGRSTEEVRDEIIQRNKRNQIDNRLDAYQNFDEDQKALISNKAEYKNGKWVVKMNNGGPKDVSQLTRDDLDNLMPTDHNERMEDYMKRVVTALDIITGEETREKMSLAFEEFDAYYAAYEERAQKAYKSFEDHRDKYINKVLAGSQEATKAFDDYIKIFQDGNENVDNTRVKIESQANNIASALAKTAEIINIANSKLGLNGNGTRASAPETPPVSSRNTPNKLADAHVAVAVSTRVALGSEVPIRRTRDGITSGNGSPMFVSANNVTPVQDGKAKVAQTDPNDTALFAKTGGPFDKLFDGIFGRVNVIYDSLVNNRYGDTVQGTSNSSVSNIYDKDSLVNNRYGDTVQGTSNSSVSNIYDKDSLVNNRYGDTVQGTSNSSVSNISLTINGKIELTGQNGQSVDIMEQLKQNPMFVRQITEMIVKQMNNNTHGGRNDLFPDRFSSH